jgi:hypothetical protein
MVTKQLEINVWEPSKIVVYTNCGEIYSRFLEVTFKSGETPIDLEGKSVVIYSEKPDGMVIFYECEIIDESGGKISVGLSAQMTSAAGLVKCEFHIIGGNYEQILKAGGLEISVAECVDSDGAVRSLSD